MSIGSASFALVGRWNNVNRYRVPDRVMFSPDFFRPGLRSMSVSIYSSFLFSGWKSPSSSVRFGDVPHTLRNIVARLMFQAYGILKIFPAPGWNLAYQRCVVLFWGSNESCQKTGKHHRHDRLGRMQSRIRPCQLDPLPAPQESPKEKS